VIVSQNNTVIDSISKSFFNTNLSSEVHTTDIADSWKKINDCQFRKES